MPCLQQLLLTWFIIEWLCRSFYHAGVFAGALELFFNQLISSKPDGGIFDRFVIQSMLFHHAVLTCPSFKGTSSALQMSSAARSQVSRLSWQNMFAICIVSCSVSWTLSSCFMARQFCYTHAGFPSKRYPFMLPSTPVMACALSCLCTNRCQQRNLAA